MTNSASVWQVPAATDRNRSANDTATSAIKHSTIDFPYLDLDNAVELSRIIDEIDSTGCEFAELALRLAVDPGNCAFRMRVACARTFGFIRYSRSGRIRLTDLGRRVLDDTQEARARTCAFLRVPLYQKVFIRFKDAPLPSGATLEQALIFFGVKPSVAERARHVLMRSARQAGFFDVSPDRLVSPIPHGPVRTADGATVLIGCPGDTGSTMDLHPLIANLLLMLPKASAEWPVGDRLEWLNAANSIFNMVYSSAERADAEIRIKPKRPRRRREQDAVAVSAK